GNGIDVIVPVESIRAINDRLPMISSWEREWLTPFSMDGLNAMLESGPWFIRNHPLILKNEDGLSAIATKLCTPLMLDSYTSDMCLQSWGRSSYARTMIKLKADVELKDTIVEECLKNPGLDVAKNLKKPSQASKGVSVGPKVGFKPAKEYKPVSKKPTANTSGNKKKAVEPTKEVSNSNSFDVLNLVDNDEELGTNGGTSNLASNRANSIGSFWNVETSSIATTPIIEKIGKIEKLIIDGKVTLVDDDGNLLKKVNYPDDHDSEDDVESVDNDMARSMALENDPYDDDMYELRDLLDKLQEICNNLDIRVRGHRKK
ncbi:hypothetical protein Tco_0962979, partial [Tanacetum coccineum]